MQSDFMMQKFEGVFAAGTGYKGIGQAQGETAGDHMSTINAAGANWTSPEFLELHGNMLAMTNDGLDESQRTIGRGDATIGCGELGQACSSQVSGILSAL
jgi:hypothetical protein